LWRCIEVSFSINIQLIDYCLFIGCRVTAYTANG
jgi:hypothetical protein